MKKLIILTVLYFIALPTFCQGWKTVKIDSAVSVKLPKGFNKTTPGDQNNFSATTGFGTILIFKDPDNPVTIPDIEKDKHLQKFYDNYIGRIKKSSADGIISEEKDTLIGDMKVKDFKLETDSGGGKQLRNFRILHANNATYTFEFLYEEIHTEYAMQEKDQFFNSITVAQALNKEDQFTDESIEKPKNNTPWLIGGGAALLVVVIIVVLVSRRKKRTG